MRQRAMRTIAMAAGRAAEVKAELLDCADNMVRDRSSTFVLGIAGIAPASGPSINLTSRSRPDTSSTLPMTRAQAPTSGCGSFPAPCAPRPSTSTRTAPKWGSGWRGCYRNCYRTQLNRAGRGGGNHHPAVVGLPGQVVVAINACNGALGHRGQSDRRREYRRIRHRQGAPGARQPKAGRSAGEHGGVSPRTRSACWEIPALSRTSFCVKLIEGALNKFVGALALTAFPPCLLLRRP